MKPILERAVANGSVKEVQGEFPVETEMTGESVKDLGRSLSSPR